MKNGKKPTVKQYVLLRKNGFVPERWLVIKDTPESMEVISRAEMERNRKKKWTKIISKVTGEVVNKR